MARVHNVFQCSKYLIFILILQCSLINLAVASKDLNEDNWREILDGEWMVEFYAPWCPACNALQSSWKEMSSTAARNKMTMKAAAVDVTLSPGLSGRFMVTALPTIFHVKDGEFRQYKGPRDSSSMLSFVEQERWRQTEPVPGWKAPHSIQMTLVAEFFKLSNVLRSVHNMLMETYGLPTWGSYLIFAVATIFVGALLGLLLVCVIDLLYPPRRSERQFISQQEVDKRAKGDQDTKDKSEEELVNEDILDDPDVVHSSDAERNSPSDSSSSSEMSGSGDHPPAPLKDGDGAEVRKRRPRKAD